MFFVIFQTRFPHILLRIKSILSTFTYANDKYNVMIDMEIPWWKEFIVDRVRLYSIQRPSIQTFKTC